MSLCVWLISFVIMIFINFPANVTMSYYFMADYNYNMNISHILNPFIVSVTVSRLVLSLSCYEEQ